MTPAERAQAFVDDQGDELSRYQRMFMKLDAQEMIEEAIADAVQAERTRCASVAIAWCDGKERSDYDAWSAAAAISSAITQEPSP